MPQLSLEERVAAEIRKIPPTRLAEVYDWLHIFRLGLEAAEREKPQDDSGVPPTDPITAFCGSGRGGSTARLLQDREEDRQREA